MLSTDAGVLDMLKEFKYWTVNHSVISVFFLMTLKLYYFTHSVAF